MSIYWSERTRNLEPYVPGEQPRDRKYIKLNTNENPYPPSPMVLDAIRKACSEDIRIYPDPDCDSLRETIARYYNLKKEQVFVGNGSDELLAFSFMAFFDPCNPILFPDITYSFYPVYASIFNINYKVVELDEEFSIPVEGFFQENGGIIIPNPNAPTGKYLDVGLIARIARKNPGSVVIIDEAYIDFGGESAVKYIGDFKNLLIIQTLSKSRSLAGLRLGYALGHEDLIQGINRVKNSFNSYTVSRLALAGAEEAFRDEDYFRETRRRIIETRERVSLSLKSMGFKVVDSKANFIFISHPGVKSPVLFKRLREKGILVRHFDKPRISDYLRVSIGSDEEMDVFLDVIGKLLV
ncbi:MAG: histidinol-phosphate transaminase [Clostridiaceae bacterium]|nr:histidinol-phosphate transaminase [Clostridiaceae bacterium]